MTGTLPVEILNVICEDLISEYEIYNLSPRWYLVPLLLVCKLWYIVSERYLCRSIALGARFSSGLGSPENIANQLLLTLEGNPRLSMLVKELCIRWGDSFRSADAHLVEICPNLRHVDLRGPGINPPEAQILSKTLATKSLESLVIICTPFMGHHQPPLPIYDLMQRWPELQKIRIHTSRLVGQAASQAPEAINCCAELREIELFSGPSLRKSDLTSLHIVMYNTVTTLTIGEVSTDTEALDALCGCLRAWSPTLEWFNVNLESMTSYLPLSEALSSLIKLQMLIVRQFDLDIDAISRFPYLKYIRFPLLPSKEVRLVYLLEDPDKFSALTCMDMELSRTSRGPNAELPDVCRRRNISFLYF